MSDAGPTSCGEVNCSGDMKGGVPITRPVWVRASAGAKSAARETPKSMTRGPSSASITLAGFRSRWTTPAPWMSRRASARPAASSRSRWGGSGP